MSKEKLRKIHNQILEMIMMVNNNTQKREQEELWKLVLEVRAKNGMTHSRMNRALERLSKAGIMFN